MAQQHPTTRWILSFHGGCATCADVAERVRRTAAPRLEVADLTEPTVLALRERALGPNPPWAPTLLAVDGDRVRAWTGAGLSLRLARLLGPVRCARTIRTLGRADVLRPAPRAGSSDRARPAGTGRRGFLRAGVAVGAFVVTGGMAVPATAATRRGRRECDRAAAWVRANHDRLPTDYDGVTAHPVAYRRAIYRELPPTTQRALWTEHLTRYRSAHDLTPAQRTVLTETVTLLAAGPLARADTDRLTAAAVAAYGRAGAAAAFATLGPPEAAEPDGTDAICDCSRESNFCSSTCLESRGRCTITIEGCGFLYSYSCDGGCRLS